jgi:hypothetical protein
MVVWTMISFVALAVAWLWKGRHIALLVDRLITRPAVLLPVSPVMYDGGGLVIGGRSMTFVLTNNLRANLDLTFDSSNRAILSAGHNAFILGPRTSPADPSGRPDFSFSAEPGDEVSLAASESLLSWPTPFFEINIFGGPSPKWRRYAYYRLVWKKPSGARLEMFWRYEQEFYSQRGWTEPLMMWNSQTGLLFVNIGGA